MSITNRGELKDAITRWLLRDSTDLVVTPDQVDNYIDMAEAEIRRELLIRDLQADETLAIGNTTDTYDLPDDFGSIFDVYFATPGCALDFYPTKKDLIQKFFGQAPGRPRGWTIYGNSIIFGPTPDAAYDVIIDYYSSVPSLTADATENIVLDKHPDVYLYGGLKQAQMQIQDAERLAAYSQNFGGIILRILAHDQAGRIPVGTRPRPKPIGGR